MGKIEGTWDARYYDKTELKWNAQHIMKLYLKEILQSS